ncbi:glutathione S-transferase [Pigmentiphaga sp. NML080357]|uniref:glutathione S-transferase family protein n=1 Tax=Pigmentiphaga sp. NML080357 TaxID=2008675 RepID=UPI000B40AA3A|nr:glutathione S-transferase family protein [Pigmentiphaga sp. NML080357]OVZ54075.1 glutathione S-transferase [Pigmentiphaga sp. NML080357]
MALSLYLHPFSSYSQKVKTAFYEKGVPFQARILDGSEPVASEFAARWPIGKFPLLVDGDRTVFEATSIIEYLDVLHPDTPRLIPDDPHAAVEARMWDRFFDHYISYPQQRIVYAAIGREADDGEDCAKWKAAFDTAYAVLDRHMAEREWAAGEAFSLADCAAAPALLYAHWSYAIPDSFDHVWAYRDRLLARPSYARALDEARPYRHLFPLGAPEGRD